MKTKIIGGKCIACNPDTGEAVTERERLSLLKDAYISDTRERKAL